MNLPMTIARRMARPAADRSGGVMERIAVVAVALSVAVMLLSVAVMQGFATEIRQRMRSAAGDLTLTDLRSALSTSSAPMLRTPHLDSLVRSVEGVRRMVPYALKGGIVRTGQTVEGVVLKGVDTAYNMERLAAWVVEGQPPRIGASPRTKDAMISVRLARDLGLSVGDRVEMLFVDEGEEPHRDRFKITATYTAGMEELERGVMITDLRNVQRLASWSGEMITGFEIFCRTLDEAPATARRIENALLHDDADESANLAAVSLQEQRPNIFDWIRTLDVNAAVVIGIMFVVALFNMTTALLILVLERTQMIGILKVLGMRNSALQRIFLYRATMIALRGLAWGNAAGLGLCALQKWGHVIKLDAEGYMLSEVPIALDLAHWVAVNAGFTVAIFVMMIIPTYIVSTIKPDTTIRYE